MPWGGGEAVDAAIEGGIEADTATSDAYNTYSQRVTEDLNDTSKQSRALRRTAGRKYTAARDASEELHSDMADSLQTGTKGRSVFQASRAGRYLENRPIEDVGSRWNVGTDARTAAYDPGTTLNLTDAAKTQAAANLKRGATWAVGSAATGAVGYAGSRMAADIDPPSPPPTPTAPTPTPTVPPPYHPSQADMYSSNYNALYGDEEGQGRSPWG
jgi:hypothetical protein